MSILKVFIDFLNSTFLNTIAVFIVGGLAYWIGKRQAEIQDSVELYASCGIIRERGLTGEDEISPFIHIQNIGTRVVYFDSYEFNGKVYETNGQVRPPTYSQAENSFYRIHLPKNQENHVSLFICFHDVDCRKWKTKIMCEKESEHFWNIKTYPTQLIE